MSASIVPFDFNGFPVRTLGTHPTVGFAIGLCAVHLIWVPRYRKGVLVGELRDRIFEIFNDLALEKEWKIRTMEVAPNYVHLFIEIHPTDAIHQVVKAFKGRSTKYLRREFSLVWTNSYFFSSADKISAITIERYINSDPHYGDNWAHYGNQGLF